MAPPFFAFPDVAAWNFNMILSVYFALGWYMVKASEDVTKQKVFIGFVIWSSFAHLMVTVATVIFDDTPAYSGPWPLSGLVGDLPPRVFGIAHWQNLLGDMPLVALVSRLPSSTARSERSNALAPSQPPPPYSPRVPCLSNLSLLPLCLINNHYPYRCQFTAADAYLAHKVFGSILLPWEL
jgi:hypothetical protein